MNVCNKFPHWCAALRFCCAACPNPPEYYIIETLHESTRRENGSFCLASLSTHFTILKNPGVGSCPVARYMKCFNHLRLLGFPRPVVAVGDWGPELLLFVHLDFLEDYHILTHAHVYIMIYYSKFMVNMWYYEYVLIYSINICTNHNCRNLTDMTSRRRLECRLESSSQPTGATGMNLSKRWFFGFFGVV